MDAANSRQIVGGHEVDPIAHNRRLGLNLGDEIPDTLLVKHAKAKDTESARLILQLCCQRLQSTASTKIEKQMVEFIYELAYAESEVTDLDNQTWLFEVADARRCVMRQRAVLGRTFTDYLLECFGSLSDSDYPAVTNAFRIRLAKGQGRSTEFERKLEIAQSVKLILAGLKNGELLRHTTSFLAGESNQLPIYIETLYRLHGTPSLAGYDPDVRQQLVDAICDQYKPLIRKHLAEAIYVITNTGRKNSIAAAEVYVLSTNAIARLVELVIDDPRTSAADRAALMQLLTTLNSYGAAGEVPAKRGVNIRGIQNIYKQNKNNLPTGSNRLTRHLSLAESRRLLAGKDPIIRQALNIIRSPNVGNHNRADLLKLQNKTPEEHKLVWRELWEQFQEQALAHERRKNGI